MQNPTNPDRRAIGYVRVSTAEQAGEGLSIEAQEQKIRDYCRLHDMELVEVIVDAGVSGAKPVGDRAGGARLLSALRRTKAPIRHVVALKLDRLFRSTVDALQVVEAWTKVDVALHLIDLGGSSIDTSNGMGRFFLGLLAGIAELERAQISERTKVVLDHKRAQGKRTTRWIPYGYRLAADGVSLKPLAKEQRVLELIDSLRADGYSVRAIARALEEKGVKPRGAKWHPTTVQRLIHRKSVGAAPTSA